MENLRKIQYDFQYDLKSDSDNLKLNPFLFFLFEFTWGKNPLYFLHTKIFEPLNPSSCRLFVTRRCEWWRIKKLTENKLATDQKLSINLRQIKIGVAGGSGGIADIRGSDGEARGWKDGLWGDGQVRLIVSYKCFNQIKWPSLFSPFLITCIINKPGQKSWGEGKGQKKIWVVEGSLFYYWQPILR